MKGPPPTSVLGCLFFSMEVNQCYQFCIHPSRDIYAYGGKDTYVSPTPITIFLVNWMHTLTYLMFFTEKYNLEIILYEYMKRFLIPFLKIDGLVQKNTVQMLSTSLAHCCPVLLPAGNSVYLVSFLPFRDILSICKQIHSYSSCLVLNKQTVCTLYTHYLTSFSFKIYIRNPNKLLI